MIDPTPIIERIKAHHPDLRKDADIRLKGFNAKAEPTGKDGRRELLVTANTARIDADREVVVPEGALNKDGEFWGYFARNRKVFFDHMYDDPSMVGFLLNGWPKLESNVWKTRFGVRRSDRGDQLMRDAEDTDISVSIGFDALEVDKPTDEEIERYGKGRPFDSIVRRWEWVELSVTWMPCNLDARSDGPAAAPVVVTPEKSRRLVTVTPHGVIAASI